MEQFAVVGQKKLKCGYTTGSCAAGASMAAMELLITGIAPENVTLETPKGITLNLEVLNAHVAHKTATCAIRKYSGDDPDVTNGMLIYATAQYGNDGINILGGEGVGTVTKKGLSVEVGKPAINPVPQSQIKNAVNIVCDKYKIESNIDITISAENGREIAKKTFNSRIGIVDGISILGTSGIVEPMSEQALVDTIKVEMNSKFANGERTLLMCPGNYGKDFAKQNLGISLDDAVTISNYIGQAIDYAYFKGFEKALLIGHAGKLLKIAAGVMQTHSSYADARQEIIIAHAALIGISPKVAQELMECITVDAALDVLSENGIKDAVMQSIADKIEQNLLHRTHGEFKIEFIMFTNQNGELARSKNASSILSEIQGRKQ